MHNEVGAGKVQCQNQSRVSQLTSSCRPGTEELLWEFKEAPRLFRGWVKRRPNEPYPQSTLETFHWNSFIFPDDTEQKKFRRNGWSPRGSNLLSYPRGIKVFHYPPPPPYSHPLFWTWFCCVAQAGLEFLVLLPLPPRDRDFRHAPSCLAVKLLSAYSTVL